MFIYILGNCDYKCGDYMEDIVELSSTDIQKILDYLSLDRMSYTTITDYSILVKIDGEKNYYEELRVNESMYKRLIEYPSTKLLEYESEYEDMKNKVAKWCEDFSHKLEEERKHNAEVERLKKERSERAMYEKLRAKYGDK